MIKYKIQALSIYEQGHYRDGQEDNIFPAHGKATDADRLYMVCDGMGGHDAGEVASQAVCEAMSQSILAATAHDEHFTDDVINVALSKAFDLLDQRDPHPESTKKMGTTMTLVMFHGDGVTMAHIGDSRIYQLRPTADGKVEIRFKSEDHSLVNDLLKVGELTPEEAKTFPRKNVITRAMQANMERRSKADIHHTTDVKAGDYFYLCSDGMLENATDDNICYMIGKPGATDEEKINMLRGNAEDNRDNHSAYLIHVLEVEADTTPVMTQEKVEIPVPHKTTPDTTPALTQEKAEIPVPHKTSVTETMQQPLPAIKPRKNYLWIVLLVAAAAAACLWYFTRKPSTPPADPAVQKQQSHEGDEKPLSNTYGGKHVNEGRKIKDEGGKAEADEGGKTENEEASTTVDAAPTAPVQPVSLPAPGKPATNDAATKPEAEAEAVSNEDAAQAPANEMVESNEDQVRRLTRDRNRRNNDAH